MPTKQMDREQQEQPAAVEDTAPAGSNGAGPAGLTAAEILAIDDRPLREVEVPEWGGVVYLRQMSAGERDRYDARLYFQPDGTPLPKARMRESLYDAKALAVALCACDADGKRLFSEDQVAALAAKSNTAIERLWEVIDPANKLSAAALEGTEGN